MPKQIKKKISKKEKPEEELKSTIETFKNYYKEHKSDMNLVAWVVGSIAVVIIVLWTYNGYTGKEAARLSYQGYATLVQAERPENDAKEADFKKALELFQKAGNKQSSPITSLYEAEAYYEMGKIDEAEKTLLEINKKYSDNGYVLPLSYTKLIDLYRSKGEKDKALEAIKKMISIRSPIYKDYALYVWAQILKSDGKNDEAEKKIEELTKNYPNSPYVASRQPVANEKQITPSSGVPQATSAPASSTPAASAAASPKTDASAKGDTSTPKTK